MNKKLKKIYKQNRRFFNWYLILVFSSIILAIFTDFKKMYDCMIFYSYNTAGLIVGMYLFEDLPSSTEELDTGTQVNPKSIQEEEIVS